MKSITTFFFYLYVVALLSIGGAGLLIAPWELRTVFHVDLAGMSQVAAATLLNQYRFLKGIEFACGCFAWRWRRRILGYSPLRRSFLLIIWAGVSGRLLSVFIDHTPTKLFLTFLIIEAVTGILMIFDTSKTNYA